MSPLVVLLFDRNTTPGGILICKVERRAWRINDEDSVTWGYGTRVCRLAETSTVAVRSHLEF